MGLLQCFLKSIVVLFVHFSPVLCGWGKCGRGPTVHHRVVNAEPHPLSEPVSVTVWELKILRLPLPCHFKLNLRYTHSVWHTHSGLQCSVAPVLDTRHIPTALLHSVQNLAFIRLIFTCTWTLFSTSKTFFSISHFFIQIIMSLPLHVPDHQHHRQQVSETSNPNDVDKKYQSYHVNGASNAYYVPWCSVICGPLKFPQACKLHWILLQIIHRWGPPGEKQRAEGLNLSLTDCLSELVGDFFMRLF